MNKIEQLMKHHTKGGRMIRHYNGEKEYILKEDDMNEILELVKNCSIPYVVVPKGTLCDEMCCENEATHIAYTEHRYNCEKHRQA